MCIGLRFFTTGLIKQVKPKPTHATVPLSPNEMLILSNLTEEETIRVLQNNFNIRANDNYGVEFSFEIQEKIRPAKQVRPPLLYLKVSISGGSPITITAKKCKKPIQFNAGENKQLKILKYNDTSSSINVRIQEG
jgi:hypothetical protein